MSVLLAAALLIHNVTVIDPAARAVRPSADVCVRGSRIVASAPCDAAQTIDGTGKYLIPGLADRHVHLLAHAWDEKGNLRARYDRDSVEQMLRTLLDFGITSVRDPGSETEAAVTLRDLVAKGALPGPSITTCGRILNASDFEPEPFLPVHSEAEVRREIRWQKAAGVDCIKVYASMPPAFVAAAIDEAHKNGLPVIGHLQRTTWTEAARMGIDGLEHAAPWSSAYVTEASRAAYDNSIFGRVYWLEHLDDAAIDEMVGELAKRRIVVDPTLIAFATKFFGDDPRWTRNPDIALAPPRIARGWQAFTFTKDWTPEQYRAAHAAWPRLLRLVKKMFDAGVPMVTGSDAPTPWIVAGPSLHDELLLLHDAGIPAMDVLRMATRNGVAEGAPADLVLLAKSPLEDLRNTRTIECVIHEGTIVSKRAP